MRPNGTHLLKTKAYLNRYFHFMRTHLLNAAYEILLFFGRNNDDLIAEPQFQPI